MEEHQKKYVPKQVWQRTSKRLIPMGVIAVAGIYLCVSHGNLRTGDASEKILAAIGVLLFLIGATLFLQILTGSISKILSQYFSTGRTAAIQFFLRLSGYLLILLITLALLQIPIDKLLLGGAALGVILSVAAQQSLANFFASLVLTIARPFQVGDHVTINSGAMGGTYSGVITDVGLNHTRLKSDDGKLVMLPNATLLSGGAIIKTKSEPATHHTKPETNS